MKQFLICFFTSQVFGILGVIFVLAVVLLRRNQAVIPLSREFLWHPVLMALSFGYLYGTSITIFRVLRLIKKVHLIRLHATLHVCLIAFAIGGFVTSFDLHYATGLPHLRNMHGLMGMITMIFFCMQWVLSFVLFIYPKGPGLLRAMLTPHHVIVGLVLYLVSICTIITGINQYNQNVAGPLSTEGVLLNFSGFFFIINVLLVAYMVLKEDFRRQPLDEDQDEESEGAVYG
ncbi:transmembrane ascorbate-dependent reductase CYB561-like [Rhodnius prolixus]|uniref:transmembrane ascorbate-dependent reductase CYB561-like n=1 Tax=Rhodnius prolixus TaxID=13249 RepID=UPI003D18E016